MRDLVRIEDYEPKDVEGQSGLLDEEAAEPDDLLLVTERPPENLLQDRIEGSENDNDDRLLVPHSDHAEKGPCWCGTTHERGDL